QAEDGIRYFHVTGVQTCALPILAGRNYASDVSTLSLSYRISGPTTVAPNLKRACLVRSIGANTGGTQQTHHVAYLSLAANAAYTLTPVWRISSGNSATATFDTALDNSITVEPLM